MNKKIIIISIVSGVALLLIGCLIGITYANKKNEEVKEKEDNNKEEIKIDRKLNDNENKNTIKNDNYNEKDNIVIDELNNTLKNIEESTQDENFKDKASSTFISIVDFLFYDGTIKGISFDELTEKGKEKVLEISSKIDVKLEEKCPGYKEKISNSTSKAYQKASKIIKKGAKNINDFAKSALGDENYQAIIDAKDELVKYSKESLNYVTGAGSKVFNNTKEKLNEWYQNFKNK
ncbi:MAG: hypothetical protein KIC76_04720 [Firmicutes bacterium]|nr:hypothetical protein [Bacillota bacterium]